MEQFFEDNFNLLLLVSLAGGGLWVLASVVYRAFKRKRISDIPEQDIRFSERWVSGFSHRNLLTKLGGARNCLTVIPSHNALIVRPMFPFNLIFLPEIYDLEHYIPTNKIERIESNRNNGAGRVIIEFDSDGEQRRIELALRKQQEFLRVTGAS